MTMNTEKYSPKNWSANDIVTFKDMNNIERGITEAISSYDALRETVNGDSEKSLQSKLNALQETINGEDNSNSLQKQLNDLKQAVANNKKALDDKINVLHQDVVTQSNLKTDIAPLLVTDSTTRLAINDGSLILEKKNTSRNVIKYAYYKRSSTSEVSISQSVSFPPDTYSLWRYKTYTLATLDSGTCDMSDEDLGRFGYLIKHSGLGTHNIRFFIEDGQLKATVGLLGGSIFASVSLEATIYFKSYNDTGYTSY